MANSRHPGVAGHLHPARVVPSRTPGSLGRHDAAQPDFFAFQGDTPGPLGTNGDSAAAQAVCRAPNPFENFSTVQVSVAPSASGGGGADEDVEVWVFSKNAFFQALSTAAGYASNVKDTFTWKKLWDDFGIKGRYYIKTTNGTDYIIFKGYPGIRETITGTRYLADNTKVLSMAIGRSGIIDSGIKGGVLTLVLVGAVDIAEYILSDDATLGALGVKLFSHMTKAIISTAIGTAAAALVVAASTPIVVPLAISIAVGVVASLGLDYLDTKFQLTEKLQAWVDRSTSEIAQVLDEARRRLGEAGRRAAEMVEFLILLKRDYDRIERELEKLRRFLSHPIPRL